MHPLFEKRLDLGRLDLLALVGRDAQLGQAHVDGHDAEQREGDDRHVQHAGAEQPAPQRHCGVLSGASQRTSC
jgi:hypothetical protein